LTVSSTESGEHKAEIGLALDTLFRSVFGSAPSSEAN
jgi:hypothetical protein